VRCAEVGGKLVELRTVTDLAAALNRRPGTIRMWERLGILPPAPYWATSGDRRGVRRLYRPEHIEGVVRIAAQEHVLKGKVADFSRTRFSERTHTLYDRLRHEYARPLPGAVDPS
jgi:hypothetical protein